MGVSQLICIVILIGGAYGHGHRLTEENGPCQYNNNNQNLGHQPEELDLSQQSLTSIPEEPELDLSLHSLTSIYEEPELDISLQSLTSIPEEPELDLSLQSLTSIPEEHELDLSLQSLTSIPEEPELYLSLQSLTSINEEPELDLSLQSLTSIPEEPELDLSLQSLTSINEEPELDLSLQSLTSIYEEPELDISLQSLTSIPEEPELDLSLQSLTSIPEEPELDISLQSLTSIPEEPELDLSQQSLTSIPEEPELDLSLQSLTSIPEEPELDLSLSITSTQDIEDDQLSISSLDTSMTPSDVPDDVSMSYAEDLEQVQTKLPSGKNINRFLFSEVSNGAKLKKKALDINSIKSAVKERCSCGRDCMKKMDVKLVKDIRKQFWLNAKPVRMSMLTSYILHSEKYGVYRFMKVLKWTMCSKAFRTVLKINKNSFSTAIQMSKRMAVTTPGKKPRDMGDTTLTLMNWLEEYGTMYGDRMPDTSDVVLPYKTVKMDIYNHYKGETPNPVSRSQFFKIWKAYFPHLKIKKTNSFSKCTTCTMLERQLEKQTGIQARLKYKELRDQHNQRQMLERKYYYGKREASRREPHSFLSMIIDGMDQSKTNMPHFKGRLPKNLREADLLKTHLTGVISHGHGGFYTFLDLNEYPHDPNLTINVLLKMLKKTAESQDNSLPPILYIQADNCGRENKNRFVLAFCELLVMDRIFEEVHLSFLQVGHTHEDVDAAFSRIADTLRRTDVETLPDLLHLLPKSEELNSMFDVKNWIDSSINPLYGVSQPLHYRFKRQEEKVRTYYKGNSRSSWISLEHNILQKRPAGSPKLLKKNFSNLDTATQHKQIETIKHMFIKESSIDIWRKFYSNVGKTSEKGPHQWILPTLPRQPMGNTDQHVDVPEDVLRLTEKDQMIPKVLVKQRKNKSKAAGKKTGTATKRALQDKPRKTQQSKQTHRKKGKSRPAHDRMSMTIIATDEKKRHIWMKILLELLRHFVTVLWIIVILLNCLRLLCILNFLEYLKHIWLSLIKEHIGLLSSYNSSDYLPSCIIGQTICCQ